MNQGITLTINAETAEAVKKLTELFGSTLAGLQKIATAGTALLGLAGIEQVAHQVLGLGSELNNLKARVGGSIADLVLLRKQLVENGGSAEAMGLMLNFMQRNIVLAAEEGGPAAKIFTDLHLAISMSQLSALSATEQYKLLGAAIAAIENPAKRTEAVMKIFGRGSGDLAAVFSDPKKFADAFGGTNAFGQVMARSAAMFHEMELTLNRLAGNGRKLVAGVLDEIVPIFERAAERLRSIDLTEVGQRIGAFGAVVVQAWKDDKFPEMIGLLIEAGFELGIDGIKGAWLGLMKSLEFLMSAEGGGPGEILLNAVMTFGVRATQFLLSVLTAPIGVMAAGFEWLYDKIRVGFTVVGNFIRSMFTGILNGFIAGWNATIGGATGKKIDEITSNQEAVEPGTTWAAAYARESKVASEAVAGVSKYLGDQLMTARAALDVNKKITETDNTRMTAVQRLNAMIDEQMRKRAAEAKAEAAGGGVEISSRLGTLRELERLQKEKLLILDKQLADVETSYTLTTLQKYEQKKKILEQQRDALMAISTARRERAGIEDSTSAETTLGRADTFEKESIAKGKDLGALGADPTSFKQQWLKMGTELKNEWKGWATETATAFASVFNNAISSISSGITGLITATKKWGDALKEIGTSIVNSVVQGIVKMGVDYVATHGLMQAATVAFHAFKSALRIADTGEEAANTAAQLEIHSEGEAGKTIATGAGSVSRGVIRLGETIAHGIMVGIRVAAHIGGEIAATTVTIAQSAVRIATMIAETMKWLIQAAIKAASAMASIPYVGPALAVAAMAAVLAAGIAVVNGFEEGGFTGPGPRRQVAGVVHKGEYVFSAPSVDRIGLANLEAMHTGRSQRSEARGQSAEGGTRVNLAFFDDESRIPNWAKSQDGESHIVDVVRRNWHQIA